MRAPYSRSPGLLSSYAKTLAQNMLLAPDVPTMATEQVRMFRPVSSSKLQQFIGWVNGTPAEYVDTKRPAMPSGRLCRP